MTTIMSPLKLGDFDYDELEGMSFKDEDESFTTTVEDK